eukprot:3940307-Rhodomonas_salina.1
MLLLLKVARILAEDTLAMAADSRPRPLRGACCRQLHGQEVKTDRGTALVRVPRGLRVRVGCPEVREGGVGRIIHFGSVVLKGGLALLKTQQERSWLRRSGIIISEDTTCLVIFLAAPQEKAPISLSAGRLANLGVMGLLGERSLGE